MLMHRWNIPPVHSLTGVYFDDGVLRFVWRKGLEFWLRDKTKDYQEEMDADTYQFRAYRLRGERSVTRFEMRPWILRATVVPFVILICYWIALSVLICCTLLGVHEVFRWFVNH